MGTSNKKFYALFGLLGLLTLIAPQQASAQICPNIFDASLSPSAIVPAKTKADDANWTDIPPTSVGYSVTGPRSGNTINWSVQSKISTGVFTKIAANYLSILKPLVSVDDNIAQVYLKDEPEKLQSWNRYYCIDGLDEVKTGTRSISKSATYVDEYEEDYTEPCGPLEQDNQEPIGDGLCERTRTVQYTFSNSQTQTSTYSSPYYNLLRVIARKSAFLVNPQYCNVDTECINDNYFCDLTKAPPLKDTAGINKAGTCEMKFESQMKFLASAASVNQQICNPSDVTCLLNYERVQNIADSIKRIDILCTDLIGPWQNNPTTNVNGGLCLYNPGDGYSVGPRDANSVPRLAEVVGGTNTGVIGRKDDFLSNPFDFSLFVTHNEEGNSDCQTGGPLCILDAYYRRVLNKSTALTQTEINLLNNIPEKLDASFNFGGAAQGVNDPWNFNFIPGLGSIDFFSEEARRFNPELNEPGAYVMQDGQNRVTLRMVNTVNRGLLEVNKLVVGAHRAITANNTYKNPPSNQVRPFISSQINGPGAVALTTMEESRGNFNLYASISKAGSVPEQLREVPGGTVSSSYSYYAYMNQKGNVIIIALKGGGYSYIVYNTNNQTFTGWQRLPGALSRVVRVSIDPFDKIHIITLPGDGASNIVYSRYRFDDTSLIYDSVTRNLNFNNRINAYGSVAISLQTDKYGIAHIVAAVAANRPGKNWFENNLYYTSVAPSGEITPPELAVAAEEDYATGYTIRTEADEKTYIGHYLSTQGSSVAVNYDQITGQKEVYIVYINRLLGEGFGSAYQAAYAKRNPQNGKWTQNLKLSDRMGVQYGYMYGVNIDRYGNAVFTVADEGTKYNTETRDFDGVGHKQCIFSGDLNLFKIGKGYGQSIKCAYSRETMRYVVAPSNPTSGGKMQFRTINDSLPSAVLDTRYFK